MSTVEIELTKGYVAVVDAEDLERLRGFKWQAKEIFRPDGSLYSVRAARNEYWREGRRQYRTRQVWMHRQIMGFPDIDVDHIDGDGLNNRKSNLRVATKSQNMANRRKLASATSKFKGVCWYPTKGKWHAAVSHNNKRHSIGYFESEADAALAYNFAALDLHGEFAKLNRQQ